MDTEWKYKYLVSYHNSILLFNSISYFFIILFFFFYFYVLILLCFLIFIYTYILLRATKLAFPFYNFDIRRKLA